MKKIIIHKLIYKSYGRENEHKAPYYLCNQAFYARENKCSRLWKKVTCKNCLIHFPHNKRGKE